MAEQQPMADDIAVVTGGTKGIGRATARALAERGATVVANYHADTDAAAETERLLADCPGIVVTRQFDVGDFEAVKTEFEEIRDEFGQLTTLVNNAGIMRNSLLLRMDPSEWESVIRTNLTGTFNCTKAVLRSMLFGDGGSIVCVSSIAAQQGWAGQSNYAASKAAIEGFVQSVAQELSSRDIRINAVAPGYTETELYDELTDEETSVADAEGIPIERIADADEIAEAICFLASERASYITGEVLRADGGLLA